MQQFGAGRSMNAAIAASPIRYRPCKTTLMNFEDIVTALTPFFQKNKFSIAESFKDYIRFEYKTVNIAVAYDWRDKSISVFVEREGKHVAELSDHTISQFFEDDIKLRNNELFTENLFKFLNGKGNALLKADTKIVSQLKDFTSRVAKEYTDELIMEQNLKAADNAWKEKNYSEFIKQLNKIDKGGLSQTYQMKYQYALKMIDH